MLSGAFSKSGEGSRFAHRELLQREIVGVDVALCVPAVNKDGHAGLGRTGGECNTQLSVAAATGPVGSAILRPQIGVRSIDIG